MVLLIYRDGGPAPAPYTHMRGTVPIPPFFSDFSNCSRCWPVHVPGGGVFIGLILPLTCHSALTRHDDTGDTGWPAKLLQVRPRSFVPPSHKAIVGALIKTDNWLITSDVIWDNDWICSRCWWGLEGGWQGAVTVQLNICESNWGDAAVCPEAPEQTGRALR